MSGTLTVPGGFQIPERRRLIGLIVSGKGGFERKGE